MCMSGLTYSWNVLSRVWGRWSLAFGRGLKETIDGLHDLYERQCAWWERQGKAHEEQAKANDIILARLGWLEFKDQEKEDIKSKNKTQNRETEGRWSGRQEHRGAGGNLRENVEMTTSTPRQTFTGGLSDTDGKPCVLMQPGMRTKLVGCRGDWFHPVWTCTFSRKFAL